MTDKAHHNAIIIAKPINTLTTITVMSLDAYVICGENHHTDEYTKDRNFPVKRVLCNKDQTVNIKEYLAFQSAFKETVPSSQFS